MGERVDIFLGHSGWDLTKIKLAYVKRAYRKWGRLGSRLSFLRLFVCIGI